MTLEAAFLEAIRAAPDDLTSRLVYADWLEEQADSRGELIRIEEEMRQLPVFSDLYWQLKLRRNELRSRAAPDWLQTMRYGTDCQPTFRHGVPNGWKERWRLIREFTDRWHCRPLGDVGRRTEEIRAVEARLGRTLPPSVREWLAFAHDVRTSSGYFDVLRDVCTMKELEGWSAVSLLLQCEGDYHWAVRHADFDLPDPPIHAFHWDFESRDETFVPHENNPIADTVTTFALGYVMDYTNAEGGEFSTVVHEPTQLLHDLEIAFPVRSRFGTMEIFEAENIFIHLGSSSWTPHQQLTIMVAKPLPPEAIPAFLWDYTHNGDSCSGMFRPRR
ncbi:MAG TPA: TIGR02996 domain-containing protein [Gemmataceae bacterium]|nr:TIGR02996 domain-containing protein [Gemmataceae bacterium]